MQSIDNSRVSIASFSLVVQDDMVQKYLVLGVAVLLYFMPVLNAQCEIPNGKGENYNGHIVVVPGLSSSPSLALTIVPEL